MPIFPDDSRATADACAELRALSNPRTVLVVDDEPSIRGLLSVILAVEGYHVLQAESAAQALDLLDEHEVDLITLDVMMPGQDGWELADELDRSPRRAAIPRIMISGKPLHELHAAPGARRAAAVLTKPFEFVELVELVEQLLTPQIPLQRQPTVGDGAAAPASR